MPKSLIDSGPAACRDRSGPGTADPLGPAVPHYRVRDAGPSQTTKTFKPANCPTCHTITLHGITAEGLTTRLDPTPLTPQTEAAALAAGRHTYHLTRNREATWRSAFRITTQPAGNHPDYAALAIHACHQPIPPTINAWCWTPTPTPPANPDQPPPF